MSDVKTIKEFQSQIDTMKKILFAQEENLSDERKRAGSTARENIKLTHALMLIARSKFPTRARKIARSVLENF